MDCSVVLVHYKTPDCLSACLDSIARNRDGLAVEIVVVDNASHDGAADRLRRERPDVRVIENDRNAGYATAVNQGMRATTGEFFLVMNPDCILRPGALATLVEFMRTHPRAGIAGPQMLDPDGSLQYSARGFPSPWTFVFSRYSPLTRWFPRNRFSRRYLMSDWDHSTARDVDWLSGACVLVRRRTVDEVGPMDESFFMYHEDIDWCRRIRQAGWSVTYVPEAVVVHEIGASRRHAGAELIYRRHQGLAHYVRKHHPMHPALAALTHGAIMARAGLLMAVHSVRGRRRGRA